MLVSFLITLLVPAGFAQSLVRQTMDGREGGEGMRTNRLPIFVPLFLTLLFYSIWILVPEEGFASLYSRQRNASFLVNPSPSRRGPSQHSLLPLFTTDRCPCCTSKIATNEPFSPSLAPPIARSVKRASADWYVRQQCEPQRTSEIGATKRMMPKRDDCAGQYSPPSLR